MQRAIFVCLVSALACACGGAAPASPAKTPDESSVSVEDMARELEQSERELVAGLGVRAGPSGASQMSSADGTEAEKPAPGASPPPATAPTKPEATPSEGKEPSPAPGSTCGTACKALRSMKRSQTRICELAGSEHERCTWAKERVAEASRRVESAGCRCPRE